MKPKTLTIVADYIASHALLEKKDKAIVALSGGADSVALLLIMLELGYKVEAAHCNFHLRGAESDRDEAFVKELCLRLGVQLHLVHFDTHAHATLHKISIEMAARNLRYAYFEQLRRDIDAQAVCVAHHREDSVETMLINLVRGTGLHGLTGISPRNGCIVRPLLCLSRNDIEVYLKEKRQPFVTDSTNLVDDVTRNKIRLDIMPLLRQINPNADLSIWRTAERLGEAAKVFDAAMTETISKVADCADNHATIDIGKLKKQPSPEYLLYEILKRYGFTPPVIEQVFANIDAPSGRIFSAAMYELAFNRGQIVVGKRKSSFKPMHIPETGNYVVDNGTRIKVSIEDKPRVSHSANMATLDAEIIAFPLYIREVTAGDRFCPFGMKGSKLVSDYLTDRKKNVFEKKRQQVVTDANGDIVWLIGERTDNRFSVTAATRRTLVIEVVHGS